MAEKVTRKKTRKKPKYEPPRVRSISERQLFTSEQRGGCEGDRQYCTPYSYASWWPTAWPDYSQQQMDATPYNPDGSRIPICHIVDEEEKFVVMVELPGIEREEIQIDLTPLDVAISATSANESIDLRFCGTLSFCEELAVEEGEARLEHGILTLVFPKVVEEPKFTLEIQ